MMTVRTPGDAETRAAADAAGPLRINGALVAALGVAHLAIAVPAGINDFAPLDRTTAALATAGNAATGLAVLLIGLMVFSAATQNGTWAARLVIAGGLFVLFVCCGYLVAMPTNPFAYTGLLLSLWTMALGRRQHHHAE
jgi:hypothetical protein